MGENKMGEDSCEKEKKNKGKREEKRPSEDSPMAAGGTTASAGIAMAAEEAASRFLLEEDSRLRSAAASVGIGWVALVFAGAFAGTSLEELFAAATGWEMMSSDSKSLSDSSSLLSDSSSLGLLFRGSERFSFPWKENENASFVCPWRRGGGSVGFLRIDLFLAGRGFEDGRSFLVGRSFAAALLPGCPRHRCRSSR